MDVSLPSALGLFTMSESPEVLLCFLLGAPPGAHYLTASNKVLQLLVLL